MPSSLLSIIKVCTEDAYILVDGPKRVCAVPTRGVKQGCPLSPLLFSLCIIAGGLSEVQNGYGLGMIPGHGPRDAQFSSLIR